MSDFEDTLIACPLMPCSSSPLLINMSGFYPHLTDLANLISLIMPWPGFEPCSVATTPSSFSHFLDSSHPNNRHQVGLFPNGWWAFPKNKYKNHKSLWTNFDTRIHLWIIFCTIILSHTKFQNGGLFIVHSLADDPYGGVGGTRAHHI